MAFKFLHAADIHLDSPMAGLLGRGDLPVDIIRGCTRRAFEAMIQLAIDEDVAFVVIAGDLYDGDWKHHTTGLFFAEQMRRLGRPCFLLRGNHDAQSVITKALRLPANVREFSLPHLRNVRAGGTGRGAAWPFLPEPSGAGGSLGGLQGPAGRDAQHRRAAYLGGSSGGPRRVCGVQRGFADVEGV